MNKGDKVLFTGENSTPFQERDAKKVLEVGQVYTIERIVEGNWFSHLVLVGFNGKFAIEMFEMVDKSISFN